MSTARERAPAWWVGVGATAAMLALTRLVVSFLVLRAGFTHVSDDDYSRTVIAEQFAHAPRLDPSGTSWLPFPFWVHGAAMLVFGRSLVVARATAVALGVLAPVLFFVALRARRARDAALVTTAAFSLPWMAWLGVATVPEALTAGLAGAGIMGLGRRGALDRGDLGFAACVLAACLCRYEAWALACVALVAVVMRVQRARREGEQVHAGLSAAVIALLALGPIGWMMWNAHAHGDALHFLARVARFRKRSGQAEGSLAEKLWFYPRAVLVEQKEIVVLAALAVLGVATRNRVRETFGVPLLACGAVLLFLVVGALGDGAPTHHPARALSITYPLLVAAGLAFVRSRAEALSSPRAREALVVVVACTLVCVPWLSAAAPGMSEGEDRAPQIARGLALRDEGREALTVSPCSWEHLALIAAFGAPERVTVREPEERTPPTAACPRVEIVR